MAKTNPPAARRAAAVAKANPTETKNSVDSAPAATVASQVDATPAINQPETARSTNVEQTTLTLKQKPGARKSDRLVIFDYTDRKGSVQFLRTLFGETVPEQIKVSGEFAPPRAAETPEERKARLASQTPADKLSALEAKVAKLREKLAKAQAAPTTEPAAEQASA